MPKSFGTHYIVELIGCNVDKLKFVKDVKPAFLKSAKKSKATIIKSFFHQFKPSGVTGLIMIAESHFALHTWPEAKYISFDVLTCGKMDARLAIRELQKFFEAKKVKIKIIKRRSH